MSQLVEHAAGESVMDWFKKKQIVVPFDFSEQCVEAVKVGISLAQSPGDVHVVHVLPDLTAVDPAAMWDDVDEEQRKLEARRAIEEKLADVDIEGVHLELGIGSPASLIVELARETDAGLILIPSHGRTGFKRLLLGSVAERVVRLAKCSVLVLKEPGS